MGVVEATRELVRVNWSKLSSMVLAGYPPNYRTLRQVSPTIPSCTNSRTISALEFRIYNDLCTSEGSLT